MQDLGDPGNVVPLTRRRGKQKKPVKAKPPRKPRAVPEIVDEFERDQRDKAQELRNAFGIEGRERVTRAFIVDIQTLIGEQRDLSSRINERCSTAHDAGVPVKIVKSVLREAKKPEQSANNQNIANQVRRLIGLVHGEQIDDMSTYSEEAADARAYDAGQLHVWLGGSERDNPYHGDVKRGQEWLRGYREAFAQAEGATSAAAMRRLYQQAQKAVKAAAP